MVVSQQPQFVANITYHMSTTNQSFLDMHYYLKERGIKNNAFFLAIFDTDLIGVNPRDPRLPFEMKKKVLAECFRNFWYFIREIVRIPTQGGSINDGIPYKLSRGNLALNWCCVNNINTFLELPRQHGKTISVDCWYLWVFNFGTTNSEFTFMNKKADDSKLNLRRLRDIRDTLPDYLKMDTPLGVGGQKLKAKNNAETLEHLTNGNRIVTKASARNKASADGIGRGCTTPCIWWDEYAFILYNSIIYAAAMPAFVSASQNAIKNHAPYGVIITTTPGDLTTEEGQSAFRTKELATKFEEEFYDLSYQDVREIQNLNDSSTFFYIRFTYQQLGSGIDYFKRMVKELEKNWPKIRREILLEWSQSSDNSPFTKRDLDIVKTKIRQPIYSIMLNRLYKMNIYKRVDIKRHPPIIGVDVSGGYNKDSSTITIIDSETTDVIGTLNCNYISIPELAKCIYELVIKYMPNAIVNIERNGGFGASVIAILKKSKIKRNLYYEIKDRVTEERMDGMTVNRRKQKVKVYGFDESKNSRNLLMEILRDRMDNHKSRFIADIIYQELCTLEVKKNGKIEHADNAHDDQIFSYLMALYVWYYGKDLMENFGLDKRMIHTDADEDVEVDALGEEYGYEDISSDIETESSDGELQAQLNYLNSVTVTLYNDFLANEKAKDEQAMKDILKTKVGRQAYAEQYHMDINDIATSSQYQIPDSVFNDIYDSGTQRKSAMQQQFESMEIPR